MDGPISVAETSLFIRQAKSVWDDGERSAFIDFISGHPAAGDVISGTGGLRKVRWSRPGIGKSGGVRVIYFFHDRDMPLYLLLIYAKAERENLRPDDVRAMRSLVDDLKAAWGRR